MTTATPPPPDDSARSAAEQLYGDPAVLARTYEPSLKDDLERWTVAADLSEAERAAFAQDVATFFHEVRLPASAAAPVFGAIVRTALTPPDTPTGVEWRDEGLLAARQRWGAVEADRRIARVKTFLATEPARATLLGDVWPPSVMHVLLDAADRLPTGPRRRRSGGGGR